MEAAALAFAGIASVSVAWSLVERDQDEEGVSSAAADPAAASKVAIDVDLGANGEPKGTSRLFFKPLLPRSEFVLLNLRVPLGLLIEEQALEPAAGAAASGTGGTIGVTGALPGFSAFGQA